MLPTSDSNSDNVYSTVFIEYPATSFDGVATVFSIQGYGCI